MTPVRGTSGTADTALPAPRATPAAPAGRPSGGQLDVTVCRDPHLFGQLVAEWRELYRSSPEATPFQSHAWLHSWWLSYGTPGRLRLVLVRRGALLVGVAPLMRTYARGPALVALGSALTDYTDVLIAGGPEVERDAVATALAAGMRRAARGGVVDLREVRAGAAAERVLAVWRGPARLLADSMCLELPGLPMDALIARVGSARGQKIRAALRRLEAAGVEEYAVTPDEVPGAVARMLWLHQVQWQGRGMTPEHGTARFAEHLTRACAAMVAAGDAAVTEFRRGGEVVAVNLTVLSPRLAGGYLVGAHPDLRTARIDLTTLLMRHGVAMAAGGGRETLSLLRGDEPHKSHWRPEPRPNQRFLLASPAAAPSLLARRLLAAVRAAAAASPRARALRARLRRSGR